MMSLYSPKNSVLSASQRHCHLILMLCLPDFIVTLDLVCQLNGVNHAVTRQDIAEVTLEIQCYYQITIKQNEEGHLHIAGAQLNQHLCLMHSLRRTLRLSPGFIRVWFAVQIKQCLQAQRYNKALYDEHNLNTLIQYCAKQLTWEFSERDQQFLQIWLQYALFQHGEINFSKQQQRWLRGKREYRLAEVIIHCWKKHGSQPTDAQTGLLALSFSQLHVPTLRQLNNECDQQLLQAVEQLIQRFQRLSGMQFYNEVGLTTRLYSHLAQALERSLFAIGIDYNLSDDVARLYPRLLRTTREAMTDVEQHYSLQLSDEEMGLIAIIFGAWLMQEKPEKQVLLLTGRDQERERQLEQQLRELTLLPLNIKYQDIADYQRHSVPKGIALVITPYTTTLPLFSPPLIYVEFPLGEQQQSNIRTLLEP